MSIQLKPPSWNTSHISSEGLCPEDNYDESLASVAILRDMGVPPPQLISAGGEGTLALYWNGGDVCVSILGNRFFYAGHAHPIDTFNSVVRIHETSSVNAYVKVMSVLSANADMLRKHPEWVKMILDYMNELERLARARDASPYRSPAEQEAQLAGMDPAIRDCFESK